MATFNGDAGPNIFTGGADADTAYGNGGDDSLSGNGNNDILYGGAGADTLDGGADNDILISFDASNVYYSYSEMVSLDIGTEHDVLIGGDGDDILAAGYGDDISGGAGYNKLYLNVLGATSGVFADFRSQLMGGSISVGGATISGITQTINIQGSNYDDIIYSVGSYYGFSTLHGNGGNDQLVGDYYNRSIYGDDGNDIVDGRMSQYLDRVDGGAGDDTLYTNSNTFSSAYGGDGNDTIYSHGLTYGGAGNDTILLAFTYYRGGVYGEAGDDDITASVIGNQIAGGAGADVLRGGDQGDDTLSSADFQPLLYYVPSDDMGLEHDVLTGAGGNDILAIGYGDDADGGNGNDTLRLSLGGLAAGATFSTAGIVSGQPFILGGGTIQNIEILAYLRGTNFDDNLTIATQTTLLTIDAGDGNDTITSNASSVALSAGNGNDHFHSGIAGDTYDGGAGFDTVYYDSALAGVTVTLAAPGQTGSGPGGDSLINVEAVQGSPFADTLTGNGIANLLAGAAGDDTLNGLGGNDTLLAGSGEDNLIGGEGNDVLYFGPNLTAGDQADGGGGTDGLTLQGNYTITLSPGILTGIEALSVQTGAQTRWGDTANNRYDYNITTVDANVAPGARMTINGQSLLAGEDFTFDGSDEKDGTFFLFGGRGTDNLTGGAGTDLFFFEADRWQAGDKVNGGGGRDGVIISAGNGLHHIEFADDSLIGIAAVSVNNRYASDRTATPSYELVFSNGNVAPGATLIVNAGSLVNPAQTMMFDGSAVHDGAFTMFGGAGNDTLIGGDKADSLNGGAGNDTLKGGEGADVLYGADGADQLTGYLGADTFRYDSVTDSMAGASDLILDFVSMSDKFDLSRIDANSNAAGDQAFTWIGGDVFHGVAGELRTYDAGGFRWIEGDTDGDGDGDLLIGIQPGGPIPVQSDFVL
jgi:Ca2+-binding RTX toxin-like protein